MPETAEEFIERKERQFEEERRKGKLLKVKDITRQGFHFWKREACTFMRQTNYKWKAILIERYRYMGKTGRSRNQGSRKGQIEYRISYFIVTRRGYWGFGAGGGSAPFIPSGDLKKFLRNAVRDGTILKRDWPKFS